MEMGGLEPPTPGLQKGTHDFETQEEEDTKS